MRGVCRCFLWGWERDLFNVRMPGWRAVWRRSRASLSPGDTSFHPTLEMGEGTMSAQAGAFLRSLPSN